MADAAEIALDDAAVERHQIDGVITGYSTAMPHLMLATLFCEHFGLSPEYANGLQLGGATGAGMVMLARLLVQSGQCRSVLVVAAENRLTHEGGRESAIKTLAQVGHVDYEVPFGATIPSYYALLASQYLARYGANEQDLAEIAVHMRRQAAHMPGAHLAAPLSVQDVMATRPIATPLKLADCCPISDGGAAFVVSAAPGPHRPVRLSGAGQAHQHQHISSVRNFSDFGAAAATERALTQAGLSRDRIGVLGIYDSFTVTLAILLEETGFAPVGGTAEQIRQGHHAIEGGVPLNTHGGLLSYGHPGVAGGMGHIAEVTRQLQGRATGRQMATSADHGYVHADGGILSAHVGLVLSGE